MNDKTNDTFKRFIEFCLRHRVPKAVLLGIPYIGASIAEMVYGGNLGQLINKFAAETLEQQAVIINRLEAIMQQRIGAIVAIGGGNAEYLYKSKKNIALGQKNTVDQALEMAGGGGANFAARLLATHHEVYPILSVGQDHAGRLVRSTLVNIAHEAILPKRLIDFIDTDRFFVPNMKTSEATILVLPSGRTAISYNADGDEQVLSTFLVERLKDVEIHSEAKPSAIRISHIHQFVNPQNREILGGTIKSIIQKYRDDSILFVNLGSTQIRLGIKYWENYFCDVDVVQLNLHEAKQLMSYKAGLNTLDKIIEWFREREITCVITVAKFGAVASYKDGNEGIVFAWPIEVTNYVDPTGAGDAFSAGMVSYLFSKPGFSFHDFYSALDDSKYWAAYACTTLGGSGDCPSNELLNDFRQKIKTKRPSTEVIDPHRSEQMLRLIDKAYS